LVINLKSVSKTKNNCKGKLQYVVKVSNFKANLLVIDYLSCLPLFSSKVQLYKDFCEVVNVNIYKNKEHETEKGFLRIYEITQTMNNRRNREKQRKDF
jgi:hypothetical protein